MDLAFALSEIYLLKSAHTREIFTYPAHFQDSAFFHGLLLLLFSLNVPSLKRMCDAMRLHRIAQFLWFAKY